VRPLFDDGAGADHRPGADHAAVADDRTRLDDAPASEPTAVDHGAGTDDHAVVDDELVVGEQMQDGVLQDLNVGSDTHRAVRVPDDLDTGADDRTLADDDVTRYLSGGKQRGRPGDRRPRPAVFVQLAHGELLLCGFDSYRGRWWN
jgi:hypothetical protein